MDASQQSEHVASFSAPSPAPPSPESSTASEGPISENRHLVPLGSYQLHPSAFNSVPICFGTVLDEETANKLGVPWDTVKTQLFNWNMSNLQRKIKYAIMEQILQYKDWASHFEEAGREEASDEDELETQGGKQKCVNLDSPEKRPRLDIAAELDKIKHTNIEYEVSFALYTFRVAVTDHHTVMAQKATIVDPILCKRLLYRRQCVYTRAYTCILNEIVLSRLRLELPCAGYADIILSEQRDLQGL